MAPPAYQRVYRSIRYNPVLKPGLDVSSRYALQAIGLALTQPQQGQLMHLGHMRSGSSLLSAILTENPEINGYGESKVVYRGQSDLLTLRGKIAVAQIVNRRWPTRRFRYVYDKVLHKRLLPAPEVLTQPNTRVLFLTRHPESTLRSIVQSFGWKTKKASDYLLREYTHLAKLAAHLPDGTEAIRIRHHELIDQPEDVLGALTAWLGLATPLKPRFDPKSMVKLIGSIDRSGRIEEGKVIQTARKHEVDISDAPLRDIEACYKQMQTTFEQHLPHWSDYPS